MTPDLIAYDLINNWRFTESLEYLDEAIEKQIGDLLRLYENRAYVYINLGDNESAMPDLKKALDIEPRSYFARLNRSLIYLSAEKYDDALADFEMISESGERTENYWFLGKNIFIKKKDFDKALYCLEKLCNIDRGNYNYTLTKGWCQSKLLNHKEAILTYQSLIDSTYYQYLIFNNLGFVYIMDGQYEQAYQYLRKGLELMPRHAYLNSNVSIVYFKKGNIDKAMQHIEISLTEGPSNPLAYYLRSKYLDVKGQKEETRKDMQMAEKFGLNEDLVVEKAILEKNLFKA